MQTDDQYYFAKAYFLPWIGGEYGRCAGPKVLVFGDSHYCGCAPCVAADKCGVRGTGAGMTHDEMYSYMEDCVCFTRRIVSGYLRFRQGKAERDGLWMTGTYMSFEKIFLHRPFVSPEESVKLWNRIAFCNFLQTAISDSPDNRSYTDEDYAKSSPIASGIVEVLRPDVVIVWGRRAYDYWEIPGWEYTGLTEQDREKGDQGKYHLNDGAVVHVISIDHPSRAHQAWWGEKLEEFLHHYREL